jgi:hypothetical protein
MRCPHVGETEQSASSSSILISLACCCYLYCSPVLLACCRMHRGLSAVPLGCSRPHEPRPSCLLLQHAPAPLACCCLLACSRPPRMHSPRSLARGGPRRASPCLLAAASPPLRPRKPCKQGRAVAGVTSHRSPANRRLEVRSGAPAVELKSQAGESKSHEVPATELKCRPQ